MNIFSNFVIDWFAHVFVPFVLIFFVIIPLYVFERKLKKKSFLLYHYATISYFSCLAGVLLIFFRVSFICEPLYVMLLPYLGDDTDRLCLFMQALAMFSCLSCCYYLYSQLRLRQVSRTEVQIVGDDIALCYFVYFVASLLFFYVNDFMMLYLVIELQGLSAYILAASFKSSSLSLEAGLKYFILGSLASGLILFGIALLYGYTGTVDFTGIQLLLFNSSAISIIYLVGIVFILSGLFFKLGLFPFHAWLPDVYSGSPFFVTALFATLPKLPLVFFFVRFLSDFIYLFEQAVFATILDVCLFFCLFSVILGIFGAFYQITLQRLIAYSSIANIGYVGLSLFTSSALGFYSALFFISVYTILMLNFFGCYFYF
jgi:NADH-quinone oxidoreductase subunit N